jgi:hypothetical protein
MKNFFALACLLFPLGAAADASAFADALMAEAAAEARTRPPEFKVEGVCTFESDGEVVELGHKHDFSQQTFSRSNDGRLRSVVEIGRWVAGPAYDTVDLRFDGSSKTALELGWQLGNFSSADDAVHVIDIAAITKVGEEKIFQQKLVFMFDMRTNPVQAYMSRTSIFPTSADTTVNKWVAFITSAGNCKPLE